MERMACVAREDWKSKLEAHGFTFHSAEGPYWNETAYYRLSAGEVDQLEAATASLAALCLEAVDRIVRSGRYAPFHLPEGFARWIEASWFRRDPSVYGRFDLAWNGQAPPKLLEYNADTPTSLIESSLSQWFWLEECFPDADQFNSIHEKLIARWQELATRLSGRVHFAAQREHVEDTATVTYLRDCAVQAGLLTDQLSMEDIGWDSVGRFVDLEERAIRTLFKLYPTDWMLSESFGHNLVRAEMRLLEPPWKLLLSSKAILPLLWEYFPGHPNLLPAHFGEPKASGHWVRKPLYSREGANIRIVEDGAVRAETAGPYGHHPVVSQAAAALFASDGVHAVIGSWVVGEAAAGICFREDPGLITHNRSQFVPHLFR